MYASHELAVFVTQLLMYVATVMANPFVPFQHVVNKDFSMRHNLKFSNNWEELSSYTNELQTVIIHLFQPAEFSLV